MKNRAGACATPLIPLCSWGNSRPDDLPPAAQADRAAFYRRMHFDLVGLPPTPEQIETYLALPEVNVHNPRFEVDKLLESPHYGERWARHWS